MARPLRIEFPGAIYHVTSRGNRREPIFVDDVDRNVLLSVVATGLSRFDAQGLAYCLIGPSLNPGCVTVPCPHGRAIQSAVPPCI